MNDTELISFSEDELAPIAIELIDFLKSKGISEVKGYAAMRFLCYTMEEKLGISGEKIEEHEMN